MSNKVKVAIIVLFSLGALLAIIVFARHNDIAVLSPAGTIAGQQRNLIFYMTILSLVVVLPVFVLTFGIAWKYRASRTKKAQYKPDWDHNTKLELIWWVIPSLIILVLAGVAWKSSHDLDPYKPLASSKAPVTIQVVALEWKWLFIYPGQNIATVNYVQFPEDTPVNFKITADAPMNSFWIPKLGGQIYAMSGMETKLHLMADNTGSYNGGSANLSGEGFAKMKFVAKSTSKADFDQWVEKTQKSPNILDAGTYEQLAKPSIGNQPAYYTSEDHHLYDKVMMKYMTSDGTGHGH